jgi:hypothetical protein
VGRDKHLEGTLKTCGQLGFTNDEGDPCGYRIGNKDYTAKRPCPHHRKNRTKARVFQMKGAIAAKMRGVLPATFPVPPLSNMNDVKSFTRDLLNWVLKKPIERWRAAEARGLLGLFVSIEQVEATNRLADAVLTAQHGGLSLTYLNQFLETGGGKPLPSRVRTRIAPSNDDHDQEGSA